MIVIRSDARRQRVCRLPGRGSCPSTRGGSTPLSRLARIIGRGGAYKTAPLLRTEPGAHGYVIRFIEFDGVVAPGLRDADPARCGHDRHARRTTSRSIASTSTVDRYKGQKRGVTLNGKQLSVLNSYISDIKAVNADSQAIIGYNGAGPVHHREQLSRRRRGRT